MDANLESSLKNIQSMIDNLENSLNDAQNKKIATDVHLQNAQQEYDSLQQQLTEMTGLSDMSQIETYIKDKQTELSAIVSDVSTITSHINTNYTYTEADVVALKGIIDKYNIPITEG